MITSLARLTFAGMVLAAVPSFAATLYVDVNSANPIPPYTNWAAAANVIQDAVDAAAAGDTVLVANGVYDTGGRAVYGTMTNRVVVDKPLSLMSVNGPEVTTIKGYQVPGTTNGDGAVRCMYLTNGAFLSGFTLANGATRLSGDSTKDRSGGGLLCESTDAWVSNCFLTGNVSSWNGGGAQGGTLLHCLVVSNATTEVRALPGGGGASQSRLYRCTVVGNTSASVGGGAGSCTLEGCIAMMNSSRRGGGVDFSTVTNCILLANSALNGAGAYSSTLVGCTVLGNAASDRGGGTHYGETYNSIVLHNTADNSGDNYYLGTFANSSTAPLPSTGIGNITNAPLFVNTNGWMDLRLQPSSPCINSGNNAYVTTINDLDGNPRIVGGTVDMGAYEYQSIIHYVDRDGTNPVPPYTNWATAANVIQNAVDAATTNDTVLVTNGVYDTGGKAVYGTMTNRVAVDKPLTLMSVNGPNVTFIEGDGPVGSEAIRCVYLTNGASLIGFTLTNGATRNAGDYDRERRGAGVWCESTEAWASNCLIIGCSANNVAGGAYRGTLFHCKLSGNSALDGGGAAYSTLNNCVVAGNWASNLGGGGSYCNMVNCTVVGNSRTGVFGGGLTNCIVYFNYYGANVDNVARSYVGHSCTTIEAGSSYGTGNITNAPLFVNTNGWADLHLQSNSPCINAGNNAYVTTTSDLDGNPRIKGGTVDMGAYEFQSPQSAISYAYLQQYGLPTDGSVDNLDVDGDLATTWQEWKMWTDPTNALSVLRLLNPEPQTNGTVVSWLSVLNHSYTLERGTNPTSLSVVHSNILGQAGTTSFTDTTATNGKAFYRVGAVE